MKLSQFVLLSATAVGAALAAPAAQTTVVTKHVHQQHTAIVRADVYVENGTTRTSLSTELQPVETATATASEEAASATAASGSQVVVVTTVIEDDSSSEASASASGSSTAEATPATTVYSSVASSSAVETSPVESSSPVVTSSVTASSTEASSAAETTSSAVETTSSAVETTSSAVETTSSAAETTSSAVETTSSAAETSSSAQTTTLAPSSSASSSSSSAPSSTSSSSSSSGNSDFASTILKAHNNKRSLHKDTSDLSWSDELASYAQDYADKYDCSGSLSHSGGPYGENLAVGYSTTGSVDAWYGEIKDYDWSNPNYSSSTGHFTQVVWKGSSALGCGIKSCGGGTGDYVICSYKTAGNFLGEFAENVKGLK